MAKIAGHTTHGMPGKMWPAEKGMTVKASGHRGKVKGGGLDPISSKTSNAKGRVPMHKKAT
jgi:hypothetical protein